MGLQETALAKQVLGNDAVSKLVATIFFVLLKQLHKDKGGKAGTTAPATRSSGRTRQKATSSSASAPLVRIGSAVLLCNGMYGCDSLARQHAVFTAVHVARLLGTQFVCSRKADPSARRMPSCQRSPLDSH
jgi:hypothetical protein